MSSPAAPPPVGPRVASNLRLRVLSALVLAPLALAATLLGGAPFAIVVLAAALILLEEWQRLSGATAFHRSTIAGAAGIAAATIACLAGAPLAALGAVVLGAAGAAAVAVTGRPLWSAGGVFYSSALLLPALALRGDAAVGLVAILYVLAIVWATDVAAYFVGRAIGGPKLAPRISPNKTWSGGLGGAVAGTVAGVVVAVIAGTGVSWPVAAIAAAASVVSQVGDLFESWLKRRFGAKDSGTLIPGHGGLMDRLDGIVAAVSFLALIGAMRDGSPAAGVLVW